uniref:Alpha/beta hydrolases superfamily protein n=1 Tax=Tanacetum cinerariifolium TaxID=118510 RepID=A0A6L2LRK4_TANCI|nr:alpha/beta hydrolases superfamily protein [Tanacetum cinerariifolium]
MKERIKSIALKAKKESSDDETLTSESDDKEYAMAVKNFKKLFRRKGKFVRQLREEKKSFQQRDDKKSKNQKAFVGGCWSDCEIEAEDKTNDETCLMAQLSNEVTLDSSHYSDNDSSFDDDSLGFHSSKASTSRTKPTSFVGSTAELTCDESIIKAYRSTIPGSVDPSTSQKVAERVFSPPMSSRSDLVINRKKLIHKKIVELKKLPLKPSLKSGLGLQIKKMEDGTFFNQSKYNKEMLKKFMLEDSNITKTLMSTKIKLTKDDEADSVDSAKYQGDKEVTRPNLMAKVVMEVLKRLLGDVFVRSWWCLRASLMWILSTNLIFAFPLKFWSSFRVPSYFDYRKFEFICHWANPVKDFKWSNVPGIKFSLFFESDNTFTSLQALSKLHYLFSGFVDYF